jgi:hypothetical protein
VAAAHIELPMTMTETGLTIRRWWWLLLALPLLGSIGGFVMSRDQLYESSFRATVLIPGDTEIPGSAERPELMVMDDAPGLVDSRAFAELVHAALPPDRSSAFSPGDVQSALSASRYSRILTVVAGRDDAGEAEAIAEAAAAVLPDAINQYLVANSASDPATVQVIDPPGSAVKDAMDRVTRIAAQAGAALVLAIVLALILDSVFPPRRDPD